MKYVLITGIALLAAMVLTTAQPACAYQNVTSAPDGGCLICHSFAGGTSATQHALHNAISCGTCHAGGLPGKNVASSACSICHPNAPGTPGKCNLVNLVSHPKTGSQNCQSCHANCVSTNTTTTITSECIDADGDTYGENCTPGPDCDDTDPDIHTGCASDCMLTIRPQSFTVLRAVFFPVQFFVIRADRDSSISFVPPVCIYWESAGIDDNLKLVIGEKLIIGFIRIDPANLTAGTFNVQVTYGDLYEKACGPIEVKDSSTSSYLRALYPEKRITAQNTCDK